MTESYNLRRYGTYTRKGHRDVCWICGGRLIWQSDFSPEDFGYEEGTDGLIAILNCSDCGADVKYTLIDEEDEEE